MDDMGIKYGGLLPERLGKRIQQTVEKG